MNRIGMLKKSTGTLLLLLLLWSGGLAQSEQEVSVGKGNPVLNRYLTSSLGSRSVRLKDDHMSPMNYFGGMITPGFGIIKERARSISRFDLLFNIGSIRSRNATELRPMRGDYFRLDIQYAYLRYIKEIGEGKYRWFVGGKFRSHANVRLNEQLDTGFITFIFTNGLSFSTALQRDFQLFNRKFIAFYQVDIGVLSHVVRPNYLNIFNYLDPENDWLEERLRDSDWLTIGKFNSIKSQLEIAYPIKAGNMIKFSYGWDFYSLNNKLKAKGASHEFLFTFMFNF
ncbi:hypothetical protein QQ008_08820 [Fulvivirgaceae bacterium BMA10]|uniref:Uncharacterized protein n=1 Tax=Splendidivirga corallicola TaxID=3051826 RepID=A0ABT8KL67_9BACT|nr:hypothetical protein [Fulvivirgaceae bacterium BMA10]